MEGASINPPEGGGGTQVHDGYPLQTAAAGAAERKRCTPKCVSSFWGRKKGNSRLKTKKIIKAVNCNNYVREIHDIHFMESFIEEFGSLLFRDNFVLTMSDLRERWSVTFKNRGRSVRT